MKPQDDRFLYERQLLEAGQIPLAGVDEAGRGPLAGPVAAAAVVLPLEWLRNGMPEELQGINDSKKLTEKRREFFYEELQRRPEVIKAVVLIDSQVIDQINILRATHLAMRQALEGVAKQGLDLKYVLVDGREVSSIPYPHMALVKGDAKSYSIGAASILAKVERDRLLMKYEKEWPGYGFAKHKGYGTEEHLAALRKLGPCPIHRKTFIHLEEQGELKL